MTAVIHLKPEGRYTDKDLERLVSDLAEVVKQKEVLHPKEAAEFMGISMTSLYKCDAPHHKIKGIQGRVYLRCELIDFIKKS